MPCKSGMSVSNTHTCVTVSSTHVLILIDVSIIMSTSFLGPGQVITVEPGIYIPSSFDVPERYVGLISALQTDLS